MKNVILWIIIALVLVGIIVGATVLYNNFSDDYKPDNLETFGTTDTNIPDTNDELKTESTSADNQASNEFEAPDFTVIDKDGNEVKLSDFKGKPIVLNFWATWCYYCKMEMPDFDEAYEKYPDVQFVMVNATDGVQETVESAKAYVDGNGYDFDIFFDTRSEAVEAYYVTAFPMTYFIDADGKLVARGSGMLELEDIENGISMITE